MRLRMRAPRWFFALTVLIVIAVGGETRAQLKGHYMPGFTGLGNGSQPPPSITLAVPVYLYRTDTIKDGSGRTIGVNPRRVLVRRD